MKGVLDFWLNCLLVLTTIFSLQRRLIELIAETKNSEFSLFDRHGETEETLPELEQIENCLERLRNPALRELLCK